MSHQKSSPRQKRKERIRKKVMGTAQRPRLTVFRSLRSVSAQLIDDVAQCTLVAAHSLDQEKGGGNKKAAAHVGQLLAERALTKNIKEVVFDRNGYRYHGVIKELADAARKAGLQF